MQGIFSSQQHNASLTQSVSGIANALGDLQPASGGTSTTAVTISRGSGSDQRRSKISYQAAIDAAGKHTPLGISLAKDLATFRDESSGGTMTTDQVATLNQNLKNDAADLNSDSEMTMITLQSLMSQRETAVQLSTNLIQSLGQQSSDITKNVGQ